jgi:hypothetical protein
MSLASAKPAFVTALTTLLGQTVAQSPTAGAQAIADALETWITAAAVTVPNVTAGTDTASGTLS